jgi:hypothetical protein
MVSFQTLPPMPIPFLVMGNMVATVRANSAWSVEHTFKTLQDMETVFTQNNTGAHLLIRIFANYSRINITFALRDRGV